MAGTRAKEEFEQFERRAALAEEQIQVLAKRVELLEKGLLPPSPSPSSSTTTTTATATSSDVAEYQKELLAQLRSLEATLEREKQQAEEALKQRDEARQALKALEKENAANEYRITILLRSLKETEERNAALEAQARSASQ